MTSDEFDSLAIFVAVVEELRREPFFSEDNHDKLSGSNVGVFCHPMLLKSAVLPFRKIWMPSERCAFRKRKKGEEGIRELVFREHPDKRFLQGYRYWFYHHFENDLATSSGYGWAKESKQEIIDLWLNTQAAHTGPKNPAKKKVWERDLADFNKCDARIGREKFEFLFRSSIRTIGHFYISFEKLLAFPLFTKLRDEQGMKPSFEADVALKYNPYPDPKYKIRFDDAFWHLNRETTKETFQRLLMRQRFSGLRDFLRSLLREIDEAVMAIICPHCAAKEVRTKEFRHKQILTLGHYVLGIVTGFMGVLIWYFSLESTFECEGCHQRFFARTPIAQVFRVIFYILIAALLIAAGIAIYIIVFSR